MGGRTLTLAIATLLVACQTPQLESETADKSAASSLLATRAAEKTSAAVEAVPAPARVTILKSETILPLVFGTGLEVRADAARFIVPGEMLVAAKVSRPRAEVRSGPGAQFDLEEFVLTQGTSVLLFDRVGVWQKVFVPGNGRRGWVHHQTLAEGEALKDPVTLEVEDLPTLLATKPIAAARSFPEREPVKVEIPKGAMFRSVSYHGDAALVVVPGTDSVMWVSRKDVQ